MKYGIAMICQKSDDSLTTADCQAIVWLLYCSSGRFKMATGDVHQDGAEDASDTVRKAVPSKRSPNYPFVDIQAAISRAKVLYDRYDDHYIPVDEVAGLWGMSNTSSSVVKILGALSQFGLINDKGKGRGREVKLTDRAVDIFTYPERSAERSAALQKAALAPKIHKEIWGRFQKDGVLPTTDDAIRIYLTRQREEARFNRATVNGFIQQLRRTLTFAGVDGDAKIAAGDTSDEPSDEDEGDNGGVQVGDYVQWTSQGQDHFKIPRKVLAIENFEGEDFALAEGERTGISMDQLTVMEPPASTTAKTPKQAPLNRFFRDGVDVDDPPQPGRKKETYGLEEGDVIVDRPLRISADSYAELEDWFNLLLRKLKRSIGTADTE